MEALCSARNVLFNLCSRVINARFAHQPLILFTGLKFSIFHLRFRSQFSLLRALIIWYFCHNTFHICPCALHYLATCPYGHIYVHIICHLMHMKLTLFCGVLAHLTTPKTSIFSNKCVRVPFYSIRCCNDALPCSVCVEQLYPANLINQWFKLKIIFYQ